MEMINIHLRSTSQVGDFPRINNHENIPLLVSVFFQIIFEKMKLGNILKEQRPGKGSTQKEEVLNSILVSHLNVPSIALPQDYLETQ